MPRRLRRTTRYRRRYARRPMRVRKSRYRRKAASQQKQRANFTIKSSLYGNVIIAPSGTAGSAAMPNYSGTTAFSAYLNLIKSNYFLSLLKMYDQVRLNSVKIKITPTQSVLLTGQAQSVFVSAWDRNGLNNPAEAPSFSEIASYSSAFQKAINLQATTWNATRMIRASTIQEKSFFIPTGQIVSIFGTDTSESGALIGQGQSLITPWNPQLLFGVLVSSPTFANGQVNNTSNVLANTQTWNYFAECEWNVTFRGVRYDIGGSAPIVNAATVSNTTAALGVGYASQPTDQDIQSDLLSTISVPVSGPSMEIEPNLNIYFTIRDLVVSGEGVVFTPNVSIKTQAYSTAVTPIAMPLNRLCLLVERYANGNMFMTVVVTGSATLTPINARANVQYNWAELFTITQPVAYTLTGKLVMQNGPNVNTYNFTRTTSTPPSNGVTFVYSNEGAGTGPVFLVTTTSNPFMGAYSNS